MTVVHMIGNAHIDPVWLWGWQAGVDEAVATLSAAADRCDEYPDFIFTCGESWLFAQVERLRPELFSRIHKQIADGKWCIVGGTYIQPDLNLPTAMALRRQVRLGQAYFHDRFSVHPRIGYNIDSFGHPASLPDLLVEHGYTGYVLGRPQPSQMDIPFAAFRWRGAGGAELPAFRIIPGYAFFVTDLHDHIMQAVAHADPALGHTMCFYGVGNHGGGPTRLQLDWILEHRTAFGGIELRLSTPHAFFDAIAPHHNALPLIEGELQHCFPGCYSAMADIKRAQRQGEHLLDQAERAATAFTTDAFTTGRAERSHHLAKIDAAWDDLLFTAFHDIVTGTATPTAWASVRAMQGRARIAAEEVLLDTTRIWAHRTLPPCHEHQIVAINTDDAPFDGFVECETWLDYDLWENRFLVTADGTPVPFQQVQPEAMHRIPSLVFPARIPPGAATTVLLRSGPPLMNQATPTDLTVSPTRLANARLAVDLGPNGISGIAFDGRSLLAAQGITLQLRDDHTDTWSFNTDRWVEPVSATLSGGTWEVEETGPLRASVRMQHRLGTSRLRWTLRLLRDEPRIFMRLEINFDERSTLLQLGMNLAQTPIRRTDAIPGGAVPRALSPAEYPVQGWSRLTNPHCEMALLSQDAYSLSVDAGSWQWTLLRSPRMASPDGDPEIYHGRDTHTDQGVHDLKFELQVGETLPDAALDIAARRMVQPLITFDRTEGVVRPLSQPSDA
jgi:alpha-mannosidase